MSLSVIHNDKDKLNATQMSGRSLMSSSTRAARVNKNEHVESVNPEKHPPTDTILNSQLAGKVRTQQESTAYLSADHCLDPAPKRKSVFAYEISKRAFDLIFGLFLLIVATPIILIAALAIRVESRGSPFFIQTRVGKNGHPFKIFKLRGMFIDSRVRFSSFYDYTNKQNLDFCFHHEVDPRVTRTGNFIRKTSIDELPNLWNVVLGDMSLVGPRPEIPEVMALYGPYRQEYLSVKPGVTCLSKCTGRDRLTKRETIEYDLDYIKRRSFRFDMRILWRTFRGVVLRRDVF